MEIPPNIHMDCRNYAPLDVTRGICQRTRELVVAEGACCESFEPLPRCKRCSRYRPSDRPLLGTCQAEPDEPMTYPDLIAVTCEWFEERT